MVEKTTEQVSKKKTPQERNPTGKGGFGDNPENRNPGGWKKENTISYQYNRFLNMSPADLKAYATTPEKDRTVAMDIAYQRVIASRKSLMDVKEITDRTEGKAPQFFGIGDPEDFKIALVRFAGDDDATDQD